VEEICEMKSIREILDLDECVLIGSRALGVHDESSDYDIVVHYPSVPDKIRHNYKMLNLKEYFKYVPLGNSYLIKMELPDEMFDIQTLETNKSIKIDLIIVEDKDYLIKYAQAIDTMKLIPKFIYKNKNLRVQLFEEILKHFGFKEITVDF